MIIAHPEIPPRAERFLRARTISAVRECLDPVFARLGSAQVGSRLANGTFWTIAGTVFSSVLSLLGSMIIARTLGQTAFGELGSIQATAGMFGTIAGFGVGVTATKYVAELRDTQRSRCGRMVGLSLLVSTCGGLLAGAVLYWFAPWLATATLGAPHLAPFLRLSAPFAIFGSIQGSHLGALAGLEAFKQIATVNWLASLLGIATTVAGAWLDGLRGAVLGSAVQAGIGCVLGHLVLRNQMARSSLKLSFALNAEEWQVLWRFTLPAFFSSVVATPAGWLARTFLIREPGGFSEIAVVSAANQWLNFVTFLPWMMSGVLVPILSNLYATGRREEFCRVIRNNLILNGIVALVLAAPLAILARPILGFYGSDFKGGYLIFEITMLTAVLNAFNGLLSRAMQSAGKAWMDTTSSLVWAVAALTLSWLLVGPYRGAGLAAAYAIAALAWAAWQWMLVRNLFLSTSTPGLEQAQTVVR